MKYNKGFPMQSNAFPKLSTTRNHICSVAHGYMLNISRWVWHVSCLYMYDTMYSCKIFIIVKNQLKSICGWLSIIFYIKINTDNLVIYQKNISKCGHIQVLSTDYQSWNGWFLPLELWPTSGDLTSSHFRSQVLQHVYLQCFANAYKYLL